MRRRLAQHGDEGFTLIEVLVVIVVLPLVVGAIAAGMMSLFTNSGTTQTRLNDSHDAQITSTYFVRDVQSSQYVSTSSTPMCGTATQLLGLSWSSLTSSGTVVTNAATYSVDPSADTLVRTFCANGNTSTVVLAHNAFVASPAPSIGACPGVGVIGVGATSCALTGTVAHAAVTVTCTDGTITCTNAGSLATTPQTSGAVGINLVRLDVLEQSGFVYNLTASPRGWSAAGVGAPTGGSATAPALQLLGNNPSASFQGGSSCSLSVNGIAAINNAANGAITLGNNNTFTASGGLYAGTSNPVSGGTSPPVTVGPPLADPYAALVPPTSSTPGVHVVSGTFKPSGQLDGIYILQNGMSLAANTTITTGPNGVLLYVTGGSVDLTGGSSVTLSKPVAGYAPVVMWVAASDSGGGVSLGGNGNVTSIGGTVYVPNGTVSLSGGGNGGGANAGAIVANKLNCQGGGNGVGFSTGPLFTTTTLTSSANPSPDGQPVTLTAQVTASQTVNTGQVLFVVQDRNGTQTADCATAASVGATGAASCVTGNLSAGSGPYTATAYYQGNAAFAASTSAPLKQNVQYSTTTLVTPSAPPSVAAGQSVTYTATVTPSAGPAATGNVTFAGVTCNGGQRQPLNGAGQATCQSAALHVSGSPYSVTASYGGSATDAPSTSAPVSQKVTPVATTTTVTSTPNPSGNKGAVTFTATVTPAGSSGAVPNDGTVAWTFSPAGASCPNGPVVSGVATCSIGSNVFTTGTYTVTATYTPGPSSDYTGSNGKTLQEVSAKAAPQIAAAVTDSGSDYTDTVTLVGAGTTPTGTVTFYLCANATTGCTSATPGATSEGSASLNGGKASNTVKLTGSQKGNYCFAAYYSGDPNYMPTQDTSADQCFTK